MSALAPGLSSWTNSAGRGRVRGGGRSFGASLTDGGRRGGEGEARGGDGGGSRPPQLLRHPPPGRPPPSARIRLDRPGPRAPVLSGESTLPPPTGEVLCRDVSERRQLLRAAAGAAEERTCGSLQQTRIELSSPCIASNLHHSVCHPVPRRRHSVQRQPWVGFLSSAAPRFRQSVFWER